MTAKEALMAIETIIGPISQYPRAAVEKLLETAILEERQACKLLATATMIQTHDEYSAGYNQACRHVAFGVEKRGRP